MRLRKILFFLTLVWMNLCFASPNSDLTPSHINTNPNSAEYKKGATLIGHRNNVDKTYNINLGYMMGSLLDQDTSVSSYFIDIKRTIYKIDDSANEYGLELLMNGQVGINVGYKNFFDLPDFYEPSYKISIAGLYKSSENIGTFINYQRYQIRGSLQLEDLFNLNRKARLDLGAGLSVLGLSYWISLGYVF